VRYVVRDEWGARTPKDSTPLAGTLGVKIHYTGEYEDPVLLADHDGCAGRVREIQDMHMDGNGWDDVAYNLLVCLHGHVFEGRGPHVLCAANGAGLNTWHYAICALLGKAGVSVPPEALLAGLREAIGFLRSSGAAGKEVMGHRDGRDTECPGEPLYGWVNGGLFDAYP
jgi:hypothetical protein